MQLHVPIMHALYPHLVATQKWLLKSSFILTRPYPRKIIQKPLGSMSDETDNRHTTVLPKNKICDTDHAGIQIDIEMQSQRHSFNKSDSAGLHSRVRNIDLIHSIVQKENITTANPIYRKEQSQ
jgi:hypothetical protein